MTIYSWPITGLWLALVAYWAVSARNVKPNIRGGWGWRRAIGVRLGVLFLVLIALRMAVVRHALRNARLYALNTSPLMGLIGVALCALGVGIAVWARFCLGRNWGMPGSQKADPALVTNGPFAYIRHPIYAGLLLSMLGSAIGQSIFWLLPLVISGIYFIRSARREETFMIERFPDRYPAYMRRTKMLVPFVL